MIVHIPLPPPCCGECKNGSRHFAATDRFHGNRTLSVFIIMERGNNACLDSAGKRAAMAIADEPGAAAW